MVNVAELLAVIESVEVKGVIVEYPGGFRLVVDRMLFGPGLYALVGPNGSGKTTLLEVLAGLTRLRQGSVVVNGKFNIYGLARGERLSLLRRHYGYLIQDDVHIEHLSVLDNILLYYRLTGEMVNEELFERVVSDLGLKPLLSRKPRELSGGERRKVSIARVLLKALGDVSVVLMDEPTTSLDAASVETVKNYLEELARNGKIVIVATHDQELAKAADTVIRLRAGQIIQE